ncbi:hypothetical protein ACW9UR_01805 [Halovulum sp. GXIMD14794]
MRITRALFLTLLLLLMLPWGAYVHARPGLQQAAVSAQARTGAATLQAHRCRIATLPGAPCGQDMILASDLVPAPTEAGDRLPLPEDFAPARSLSPAPPRDPPRLI